MKYTMDKLTRLKDYLDEYVTYDKEEGKLYWKKIPTQVRAFSVGDECGYISDKGFRDFSINGRIYKVSHLIYFLETGEFPKRQIIMRDGDKLNTRYSNMMIGLDSKKKVLSDKLLLSFINDFLRYDKDTGKLYWNAPKGRTTFNKGDEFSWIDENGYKRCTINRKQYLVHKLIWFIEYGKWPLSRTLVHLDGDKLNNRKDNLEEEISVRYTSPDLYTLQCFIEDYVTYDKEEGKLYWKKKANELCDVSKEAGHINKQGYKAIRLCGLNYKVHNIIWIIETGRLPMGELDHVDHDPSNNRISNLRDVSHQYNMRNLSLAKNNTSGYTGVSSENGKWRAVIKVDGKVINLGLYKDKSLAIKARAEANKLYGFHANHGMRKDNASGYTGIKRSGNKWRADITINGKRKYLGTFYHKQDAINARIKAKRKFNFHTNHGKK